MSQGALDRMGPWLGSLPDVWVPNASERDWQAFLDLVVEQGWTFQYSEGSTALPLPSAEVVLSRPADAEQPHLEVRPVQDILAICQFYAAEGIDFDVNLREIQGRSPSMPWADSSPRSVAGWVSRC